MKQLLKKVYSNVIPKAILERRDKMGFPVPLKEWFDSDLQVFVRDLFASDSFKHRYFLNHAEVNKNLGNDHTFSRKTWGLLSLELWKQQFHDKEYKWKQLLENV